LATAIVGVVGLLWAYSSVHLPPEPPQPATTVIRDAKGNQIAELYKGENRIPVSLDRVADVLERAVISAEDRHFYEHRGVDPVGTIRAFVNDARGRRIQGGSTLTQQLVKNTYLTSERSLSRKFKEAILAVKVEQSFDKRTILDRYLNTIYFGRGASGIEKAAELYFGVPASELDLGQSALLAGLIRAPEAGDPDRHPDVAKGRRALVLDAMVRDKVITAKQAAAAKAAPLGTIPRQDPNQALHGSTAHFAAMVQRWTVDEFGTEMAQTGGLRVDTTLEPDLQAAAEKAITSTLDRPDDPNAALVSMADDGAVLALIGGKDFQASQVNLAIADPGGNTRPQPGSTFKPFVLAAALKAGIPVTRHYSGPPQLTVNFPGLAPYVVDNYSGEAFGDIDLTDATAHSVNTVYEQLAVDVGLDKIIKTAHDLGVESKINAYASTPLGTANLSPMEMVRAYMTFANRGRRPAPYFVKRVTDSDGNVLYDAHIRRDDVYPAKYADVVNAVLQQVIKRGTGGAANIGRDAAGKTGTTNDNTDAWFVGYTPHIGTAVWLGYTPGTAHKMNGVHGIAVTGGTFPAQIWKKFMTEAVKGKDTGTFTKPDDSLMNATTTTSSTSTTVADTTTTSSTSSSTTSTSTTTTTPGATSTTATTSPQTSTSVKR
jgi:penicillin-binding protein 1A